MEVPLKLGIEQHGFTRIFSLSAVVMEDKSIVLFV